MRWVYGFDETDQAEEHVGGGWDEVLGLLGGKGANLGEMTRLGMPVPPGFTITTEACNAYLEARRASAEGLWRAGRGPGARRGADRQALRGPGRPAAGVVPLGRQVLHAGDDGHGAQHRPQRRGRGGLVALTGDERFVYDSYRRLVQMFGAVVLGIRDEPFEDVLARTARRRASTTDADLPADDLRGIAREFKEIVERSGRTSPTTRSSSCAWRSRRSSARGTASGPSTTATPPASPTTSAPR